MVVERRGSVAPIMTLMLVPLIGALGIGAESSGWFFMQRAAQNAADAAVMAAASNNNSTAAAGPTYDQEAAGVATNYGFTNGASNATVSTVNNATCPSGGTNCYQVTITKAMPVALASVVGYSGNTTVNGEPAVLVTASAMASAPIPANDCMVTKVSFQTNGAPKFNAGGCTLYSNGTATCNGKGNTGVTGLGFIAGYAEGTDTKCQVTKVSSPAADPYASLLTNSTRTGCPKAPAISSGTWDLSSSPCVSVSGTFTAPAGTTKVLTDTSSVNKGTVVVVQNGANIVLNGTLSAAFGQGLTIVFTNAAGATPGFISGNGTIDYGAPASGPWSGVALYQDPVAGASNVSYSGNSPTFNITGLIYAPNAAMTFSGAINHETGGYACLGFYVSGILINGTGSIFNNPTSQCYQAGLTGLPTAPNSVSVRQALVQ